jgi:TRAP-type mannitol/chloroaromatic compound transport system substrate-binding protein
MDRREFLITTSGAAVAASSAAATVAGAGEHGLKTPAVVSNARTFELAMPWRDDGRGAGDSARRLARRIEAMTDGRYRIEITAEAPASFTSSLQHGSAHDYAALNTAFAYFAGLPGTHGLAAQDFATWLTVGGGQMLWDDLAAEADVKPLLAGHSGATPPLWSSSPLASLSDIAGRKLHAPGLAAEVARALGAEPVSIKPQDLTASVADGSVDIVEWGGLLTSMASGIAVHAKHATGTGLNTHGTALALHVSLSAWNSLSAGDKAIFEAAALQEFHASCAEARTHEAIARTTLASRLGVAFAPFAVDIAEAVTRVSDAMVAHVAGRDATSQRINHSYMAFKAATVDPRFAAALA